MRGKQGGEEEKEGRLYRRKQWEQGGCLGSQLFPVCDTCQVSSLHLLSHTASEAQLCVLCSLITLHAAQGLQLVHNPSLQILTSLQTPHRQPQAQAGQRR